MSRVLMLILLCTLIFSAQVAWAVPVLDVRVSGNVTVGPETILDAIKPILRPGQELLDPARAMQMVEGTIARMGYFESVQATYTPTDAGYVVVINLSERQRAAAVEIQGNVSITSDILLPLLGTQVGRFLDGNVLRRDTERIADAYDNRGLMATVSDVNVTEDGKVSFIIREAVIESSLFGGLHYVTDAETRERLAVPDNTLYREDTVAAAMARLRQTNWFSHLSARLLPGKVIGAVILQIDVDEMPGVFPERLGKAVEPIDQAKLREEINALPMDIEYAAAVRIDGYLLDLKEDIIVVLPRLQAAVAAINPASIEPGAAETVYEYARALDSVGRFPEARQQFKIAAMMFSQLIQGDSSKVVEVTRLADCLNAIGEAAQGLEVLRQAIQVAPDDWRPRTKFAVAVATHLLGKLSEGLRNLSNPNDLEEARTILALPAVVELLPWEKTRDVMLGQLGSSFEREPLVALAREARNHLAEGLKLAGANPLAWRDAFEVTSDAFYATAGIFDCNASLWQGVSADVGAVVAQTSAMAETDPGVALWAAFCQSFHAVLVLSGAAQSPLPAEMINEEFLSLGRRLDEIQKKWPTTLAASGGLIGIVRFLAGDDERARATFEELIKVNPFDRDTYNALLGLAYSKQDWPWMKQIVLQRINATPAVDDYAILARIAQHEGKPDEGLIVLRDGITKFPNNPESHLNTAAWLLANNGNTTEAESLIATALTMNPNASYALALRSILCLLQNQPVEAKASLSAALTANPRDELANILRNQFFVYPE